MLIFIFCVCFSHFYNKKSIGNYYLKMWKNYDNFFLIPIYKIKLHPHWWSIIYLSQKWTLDFWAVKWTYLSMRLYYNATNFKSNIFPFGYIVYLFLMKKKKKIFCTKLTPWYQFMYLTGGLASTLQVNWISSPSLIWSKSNWETGLMDRMGGSVTNNGIMDRMGGKWGVLMRSKNMYGLFT